MNKITWTILIILVLAVAGFFYLGDGINEDMANGVLNGDNNGNGNENEEVAPDNGGNVAATITYSDSGFSPNLVEISLGETVMWVNESGHGMWVGSAMHPTHTVYPGSDIKKCGTGEVIFDQCGEKAMTFRFTFNEAGEWGYHNHSRASHFGKVIVK